MPPRAEREDAEQLSTSEEAQVAHPLQREESNEEPPQVVTLGAGSRSCLVENGRESAALLRLQGLIPVPAGVEAEVKRREAQHPMTPEYRKILRDRLTLEHYFADVGPPPG